jgi:hypothetical protein
MPELLDLVIEAHGLKRWNQIKSIGVDAIISGQLLEAKGRPAIIVSKTGVDIAIRTGLYLVS